MFSEQLFSSWLKLGKTRSRAPSKRQPPRGNAHLTELLLSRYRTSNSMTVIRDYYPYNESTAVDIRLTHTRFTSSRFLSWVFSVTRSFHSANQEISFRRRPTYGPRSTRGLYGPFEMCVKQIRKLFTHFFHNLIVILFFSVKLSFLLLNRQNVWLHWSLSQLSLGEVGHTLMDRSLGPSQGHIQKTHTRHNFLHFLLQNVKQLVSVL